LWINSATYTSCFLVIRDLYLLLFGNPATYTSCFWQSRDLYLLLFGNPATYTSHMTTDYLVQPVDNSPF